MSSLPLSPLSVPTKRIARFAAIVLLGLSGCDALTGLPAPRRSNVLDPEAPSYQVPQATIVSGPANNATVHSDSITFVWQGNNASSLMEFSTRMDSGGWSFWGRTTGATYSPMQDGPHRFDVLSRMISGDMQRVPVTVDFVVDAYNGTTVLVKPPVSLASVGTTVGLGLWFGEAAKWSAAHIVVRGDTVSLAGVAVAVQRGPGTYVGKGSLITAAASVDSASATMIIDLSLDPADSLAVSGTGLVATLSFRVTTTRLDTAHVIIDPASWIRKGASVPVSIMELRPAAVAISGAPVASIGRPQ